MRKRVTESRHMAVTEPASIVDLIGRDVVTGHDLPACGRCLQLPVVQAVKEHLCKIIHGLPITWGKLRKLVKDKVGDTLGNAGSLKRRMSKWTLHHRPVQLQDALAKELKQVKVDLGKKSL